LIAQGDDYDERNGRSIRLKSLEWFGNLTMNASATNSQYRLIIFVDHANQGVAPAVTDLLVSDAFASMRNGAPDNMKRYTILSDELYLLDSDSHGATLVVKGFRKLETHMKFSGTGAAVASQGENSIWAYAVSNEATNTVAQNVNFRLRYIDN